MSDQKALQRRVVATLQSIDSKLQSANSVCQRLLIAVRNYHSESARLEAGLSRWGVFLDAFHDAQMNRPISDETKGFVFSQLAPVNTSNAEDTSIVNSPRMPSPPRTTPFKRSIHDVSGSTENSTPRLHSPPRTTPLMKNRIYSTHTPAAGDVGTASKLSAHRRVVDDSEEASSAVNSTPRMHSPPRTLRKTAHHFSFASDSASSTGSTPRMPSPPRTTLLIDQGGRSMAPPPRVAQSAIDTHNTPVRSDANTSVYSESAGEVYHTPASVSTHGERSVFVPLTSGTAISALKPSRRSLGAESVASFGGLLARLDEVWMDGDQSIMAGMDRSFGVAQDLDDDEAQPMDAEPSRIEEPAHGNAFSDVSRGNLNTSLPLPSVSIGPLEPKREEPVQEEESEDLGLDAKRFPKNVQSGNGFQELVRVYSVFFVNPDPNVSSSQNTLVAFSMDQLVDALPELKQERIKTLLDLLVSRKYLKPMYVQGAYYWRRASTDEQRLAAQ